MVGTSNPKQLVVGSSCLYKIANVSSRLRKDVNIRHKKFSNIEIQNPSPCYSAPFFLFGFALICLLFLTAFHPADQFASRCLLSFDGSDHSRSYCLLVSSFQHSIFSSNCEAHIPSIIVTAKKKIFNYIFLKIKLFLYIKF